MANDGQREQAIREAAYRKWEQAGRPEGDDLAFWLEAEREVGGAARPRPAAQPAVSKAPPAPAPAQPTASKAPPAPANKATQAAPAPRPAAAPQPQARPDTRRGRA
jgi:Protein of unknown function (DUF2934)